jgi:hypothetical protein
LFSDKTQFSFFAYFCIIIILWRMPGLMKRLFSSSSGTSKSGRKGSVSSGDAVAASQPNKGIEAPESNAAKQIPSLKTQPEGVEGAAPSVYSPLGGID